MCNSDNVQAFEAALKENRELRAQYETALQRIQENKEATCDGEAMVKAAAEAGYTLTMAEMERFMAENQNIDDEAMTMVASGKWGDACVIKFFADCHQNEVACFASECGGHNGWCLFGWHCYAAIFGEGENNRRDDINCHSNYLCFIFSKSEK